MVVVRTGTDEVINTFNAIMCAFAFPATETIVDKLVLKNRRDVFINKMMNNPVTKISRKYFPFYGFIYNETYTWFWFVAVFYDFIV